MAPHCTPPLTPDLATATLAFVDRLTWALNLTEQVQGELAGNPTLRDRLPASLARHLLTAQRALLRAWDGMADATEEAEELLDI